MGRTPAGAPNELARAIVDAIERERERSGVSTPALIRRTGISANYYYKRTRLEAPFNVNDLQTIADALGISPRVFLEPAVDAYERMRDAEGIRAPTEVLAERASKALALWSARHPGRDVQVAVTAAVDARTTRITPRQWARFLDGDAGTLTDDQIAAIATFFDVTPDYFRRAELGRVEDDLDAQIEIQLALVDTGALGLAARQLGAGDPSELRAIASAIRTAAIGREEQP
jgi:transcriptional regulator with XRE-family HTH domain